jgi:RNase P subunit RPR2
VKQQQAQVWRCQACGTLNQLTFSYADGRLSNAERKRAHCVQCNSLLTDVKCLSLQVTRAGQDGAAA